MRSRRRGRGRGGRGDRAASVTDSRLTSPCAAGQGVRGGRGGVLAGARWGKTLVRGGYKNCDFWM